MSYATVEELRQYLEQVPADEDTDDLMESILERATALVDGELTFGFSDYGEYAEATARDVWSGAGGKILYLPAHQAESVESVNLVSGRGTDDEALTEIDDYVVETRWRLYRDYGWLPRTWYRVEAIWGVGAVPPEVVQVTLEVAMNIWQGRGAGRFSESLGVEGSVAYNRAVTWAQKSVLATVRQKFKRAL